MKNDATGFNRGLCEIKGTSRQCLRRQSLVRRPIGESPMAYQLRSQRHSQLVGCVFFDNQQGIGGILNV